MKKYKRWSNQYLLLSFLFIGALIYKINVSSPNGNLYTFSTTRHGSNASKLVDCPLKGDGDANCDNRIDFIDLEILRRELTGTLTTKTADFNGDGQITVVDVELFRKGLYKYLGITPSISPDISPTGVVLPVPLNVSASCSASGNQAVLRWDAVSGASAYWLIIDDLANTWSDFCAAHLTGDTCTTTQTNSYTFSTTPGHNFRWGIQAYNGLYGRFLLGPEFTCVAGNVTPTPQPTIPDTPTPFVTPTVAPTNNPTVTPTPPLTGCTYPAQILNLANWKVTLPIGSGSPTEITQPALNTYSINPWFKVNADCTGVQFRAHTSSPVTTSNSSYPRSELREMINNGSGNASWSSTSGTHTMILDEAITAVPTGKKHVVSAQIHDSADDVMTIRLEYPKLFIDLNGVSGPTLDPTYTLGKRFTVKIVVSGGVSRVYYNNSTSPAYEYSRSYSGAYFKAGAYTQSNCDKESQAGATCSENNYGEVMIYGVSVLHQ